MKPQPQAQKISKPLIIQGMKTSRANSGPGIMTHSRSSLKNYSKPKTQFQSLSNSRPSEKTKRQKKNRILKTNPKGPIRIWVPRSEIVYVSELQSRKGKAAVMVPGQWLLTTHDRRKAYVPNPDSERGRLCGIWRKTKREDHWYEYSW
jgi:hypothetical protein